MLNRRRFLGLMTHAGVALAVVPVLAQVPTTGFIAPQLYGDGVHDDAPWLQWQVDNARGPITIPAGTYALGKTLMLSNGARVLGSHFVAIGDRKPILSFPKSAQDIIVMDCYFDYSRAVAVA